MKRFLKDPLLHFLLAGVVIFAVVAALTPAAVDDKTIVIDRPSLLTFIQYRLQSFDEDRAARRLDGI